MNQKPTLLRVLGTSLALAAFTCGVQGAMLQEEGDAAEEETRYLRVVDEQSTIALEIASVDFHPADDQDGPRIGLIGVSHIGDAAFYRDIEKLLRSYDVVLFEAIQPAGVGPLDSEDPQQQQEHTEQSMHLIASVLEAHRAEHEEYPEHLSALVEFAQDVEPIMSNWLRHAKRDAWGSEIEYTRTDDGGYHLLSLGADTKTGGDDDIERSSDQPAEPFAVDEDNLQQRLAEAFNLEFQLTALPYGEANWRPSDMTMPQLNQAMAEKGVDMSIVGGTLAGTSFPAKLISGILRIVGMLDAMAQGAVSDMMKIMMIEMLGDELALEAGMSQMGEGFAEVIVDQRNQVVVDDLVALARDEPDVTSVAVLYGAAHMDDLAKRLAAQMEYHTGEMQWLRAIAVDLDESQLSAAQARRMRFMVRRMMHQQMRDLAPDSE